MANFATLADALAGCVAWIADDSCAKLFVAATPSKRRRADRHAGGGRGDHPIGGYGGAYGAYGYHPYAHAYGYCYHPYARRYGYHPYYRRY
jgi:hypothetical protein